jgi:hypothetical protein
MKEILRFKGGASELEVDLYAQMFSDLSARWGGGKTREGIWSVGQQDGRVY